MPKSTMPTPAPPNPAGPEPLWVFGYGSLIWDPGFAVAESVVATAHDHHRSFCMWSVHYRGTAEAPGLVLALDAQPQASCQGVALRAQPGTEADTLAYLRARELISYAYVERLVPVTLTDGRRLQAIAYVIDRDHPQYCRGLGLEDQAQIIARAQGERGANRDYLNATAIHLKALGLQDPDLVWLTARVALL